MKNSKLVFVASALLVFNVFAYAGVERAERIEREGPEDAGDDHGSVTDRAGSHAREIVDDATRTNIDLSVTGRPRTDAAQPLETARLRGSGLLQDALTRNSDSALAHANIFWNILRPTEGSVLLTERKDAGDRYAEVLKKLNPHNDKDRQIADLIQQIYAHSADILPDKIADFTQALGQFSAEDKDLLIQVLTKVANHQRAKPLTHKDAATISVAELKYGKNHPGLAGEELLRSLSDAERQTVDKLTRALLDGGCLG